MLRPDFSPICVRDNIHNTTKQGKEMEIVECNIATQTNTRKLGKIMDHFIHLRWGGNKITKKAHALGPKA
jgi:hypothetical protein